MEELARILLDHATLSTWSDIYRSQGAGAANAWLNEITPGGISAATGAGLVNWYAGSRATGNLMRTNADYVPAGGDIPIDPRLSTGLRYEVTARYLNPSTGREEYRTLYTTILNPVSQSELNNLINDMQVELETASGQSADYEGRGGLVYQDSSVSRIWSAGG